MAVIVKNKKGKDVTLLSPKEKGHKYASELRNDYRFTNDMAVKQVGLSDKERAYRAGYLQARKDIGKAAAKYR